LFSALGLAGPARAQSAADAAAAEALYDEGTRLFEAGDYAGACPKLAESYRLDPALGALLALAACRERSGQIASAWVTYLDVVSRADAAGDTERGQAAEARADALAPRLPRLAIELDPAVASLPGLAITRDGQTVDPRVASTAVPVDPGEHVVVVRATGKVASEQHVTAVEGRRDVVRIDRLAPERVAPAAPHATAPPPSTPADGPGDHGLSGWQTAGLVAGGVGVVALGVGLGFGAVALGAQGDLEAAGYDAGGGPCARAPAAECADLYDDAAGAATLSSIFTIGGGLLAATGLVLVLVGGDEGDPAATGVVLAPAIGGMTVRGAL
jgi:hypothetical protein